MKSIKSNFEKIAKSNPNLGSYPCLAKAVEGKKFSRKSLVKAYYELMPKDEYSRSESKEHINHLEYITNLAEEGENHTKNLFTQIENDIGMSYVRSSSFTLK